MHLKKLLHVLSTLRSNYYININKFTSYRSTYFDNLKLNYSSIIKIKRLKRLINLEEEIVIFSCSCAKPSCTKKIVFNNNNNIKEIPIDLKHLIKINNKGNYQYKFCK